MDEDPAFVEEENDPGFEFDLGVVGVADELSVSGEALVEGPLDDGNPLGEVE